jgi:glyoxylase-like metal-dependent hydrolase (beta-lactamase superfamily II)
VTTLPIPISGLATLDRTLVYVFVAGPGVGEAIAIALPQRDWVLIDSCQIAGQPIMGAVFRRFARPNDVVRALVLTHPHDDHAGGFAKMVEEVRPERLVVTAKRPEGPHLVSCASAWLRDIERSASPTKNLSSGGLSAPSKQSSVGSLSIPSRYSTALMDWSFPLRARMPM